MTLVQFRVMVDTDLIAFFSLTELVARVMIEAGHGSIINITSLGPEPASPSTAIHSPRTAWRRRRGRVTWNLASEWWYGVRVPNAVGPAFFPTRLSGSTVDPEQVVWIEQHTAVEADRGRIDELDGMITFLASDASSYITGQQLYVDGSWSVY